MLLIESAMYAFDSYRNQLVASWIEPSRLVDDTATDVVDLDGDGRAEVVVTDAANDALITRDHDEQANTFVKTADLDCDGDVEAFVLNQSMCSGSMRT